MPQYIYTAMDGSGREQKGKLTAPNEEAAALALKSKGLFPTSLKVANKPEKAAAKAAPKPGQKKAGGGFN